MKINFFLNELVEYRVNYKYYFDIPILTISL